MTKKTWEKPTLTIYGSVEEVTEFGVRGVAKIGKFLLPKGLGLFASLAI